MATDNEPLHFSPSVMASLSALCDTLVPACHPNLDDERSMQASFYELSASEAHVPRHVAEVLRLNVDGWKLHVLTIFLWLLSSRIGTFLVFGTRASSGRFPYLQRFADLPSERQEQLLLSCSHSSFLLLRLVFRTLKAATLFSFYTKIDKDNYNPTWSAIGYSGPDPVALASLKIITAEPPPLRNVIDASATNLKSVSTSLKAAGLDVHDSESKLCHFSIKCDVVVVGSGCGGGVCAGVLAQSGLKVVVIEKGKYIERKNFSLLEGPSMRDMYERGGMLITENGEISIMAGSTLGGGSAINWGASFRTPPHILEEWGELHKLQLFTSVDFERALDTVCSRIGVQNGVERENLANQVLRKGCKKLGYHVDNVPLNSDAEHFCGWCGFGCWSGKKQATSETWLKDAVNAGAVILTSCKALQVVHRKPKSRKPAHKPTKAVGVIASIGSHRLLIEARATVIACGSLHTPHLLLNSGLKNSSIGKNLHLHLSQDAWGYFPESAESLPGVSYEGNIITAFSKGDDILIESASMHPGLFASNMPWISGLDHKERMARFARTIHIFALVRDRGSGSINTRGEVKYEVDEADEKMLREGLERALRVLIAGGADEVGTHHVDGYRMEVKGASDLEIEDFLKVAVRGKDGTRMPRPLFSAHQMGSCRMGVDPKASAVDGRGEAWEVEGLFVSDASVFPTAIGVNPMVTVEAIAYCISQSVVKYVTDESNNHTPCGDVKKEN